MRLSEASPKMILAITDRTKDEIQAKDIKRMLIAGFFKFLKNVVSIISFLRLQYKFMVYTRIKKILKHIFIYFLKYIKSHENKEHTK
jgi:hypothetical protein